MSQQTSISTNTRQTRQSARPYRSHRRPACRRCRIRKARCTIEVLGQPCLLCRMAGIVCSAASVGTLDTVDTGSGSPRGTIHTKAKRDRDSHIIGPILARDTQVLDDYVYTKIDDHSKNLVQPIQRLDKPIYRAELPPRRASLSDCNCSGQLSRRLIVQVESHMDELVAVYLNQIHVCLPLMPGETLRAQMKQFGNLPESFLINFIAYVSFYWRPTSTSVDQTRPDQDFAWQAAVSALERDCQRSDKYAIMAAVLSVAGRPSKGFVHNTVNVAKITALAHSIGLNHDCQEWKMNEVEKKMRINLWWAVLIHDRWFNFAQGTPPYVNKKCYDVLLPATSSPAEQADTSSTSHKASECYLLLCQLTEIVGDVLPTLYHVRSRTDDGTGSILRKAESELRRWHVMQPDWLHIDDVNTRPQVPGLANLQLSYLAFHMLLRRLALHEASSQGHEVEQECISECTEVGQNLASFVGSLTQYELMGFWLPYNAHHFISCVTLLLRCALQADDRMRREQNMEAARQLVRSLTSFRDLHQWDLAEIALPQSQLALSRVEAALPNMAWQSRARRTRLSVRHDADHETGPAWVQSPLQPEPIDVDMSMFDPIESMFPELFSELTDNFFFDQQFT